jgi:Gas vesicle synthesis protein GvpL/GvpF
MIYVYALAESDVQPVHVAGINDSTPEVIVLPSCAAIVSRVTTGPDPDEASLRRHEEVVEQVMQRSSVIPLRFGQVLNNEEMLRDSVAEAAHTVEDLLRRFAGKVELGVRGLSSEGRREFVAAAAPSGREYMEGRLEHERMKRAQTRDHAALADLVHKSLSADTSDSRLSVDITPRMFMSGAYLIARNEVDPFLERLREVESRLPESAQLMCTGPWPPYSFSDIELGSEVR